MKTPYPVPLVWGARIWQAGPGKGESEAILQWKTPPPSHSAHRLRGEADVRPGGGKSRRAHSEGERSREGSLFPERPLFKKPRAEHDLICSTALIEVFGVLHVGTESL